MKKKTIRRPGYHGNSVTVVTGPYAINKPVSSSVEMKFIVWKEKVIFAECIYYSLVQWGSKQRNKRHFIFLPL